jgi:predicted DNA-binding protein
VSARERPGPTPIPRIQTSVRLPEEAHRLMKELARRMGVSQATVLALAIRRLAREEGIE